MSLTGIKMEVPKGVMPDSPQAETEEVIEEEVIIPEVIKTPPPVEVPKGAKTPDDRLYAALADERRLRKEAEDKLLQVTSQPQVSEAFSDEGKLLEKQIKDMRGEISTLREERLLSSVYTTYPKLKDLSSEFDTFRTEYPAAKVENVAKLFLMEKGLLTTARKGLERQTSGGQAPTSDSFTAEEIADLRRNNHRKYMDLIMAGKIKFDELK